MHDADGRAPTRLAEFDALFAEHVTSVQRAGETVCLQLHGPETLRDRVQDLADRESSCCSFFTFVVAGTHEDLTLEISVPPARREILDSLYWAAELAPRSRG